MKFRLIFFLASLIFVSAHAVTPAQSAVYYQVVFPTDGHIINVRFGVDSNRNYNLVMPIGTSAGDQAYILSLPQFNNFGYSGVAPIVTLGNVIDPAAIPAGPGTGTVTLVSWVGGIVSIANPTTTPQFTIAGTSGGIPYFSNGTTWASSAALANQQLMIGGGAGGAPATTSTASGILTFIGAPSSANLFAALTDKSGSAGSAVFSISPAFTTSVTTPSTSFSVFNTTATTVNAFGGASVALNMGHASGATSMLGIIGLDGATPSPSAAVVVPASTTGVSSLRILPGVAPTAPVNGDAWTTSAGLFIQINGSTVGPLAAGGGSGTVSSGTVNRLSKYTGATTVGNSLASDDGTTFTYTGTGGISLLTSLVTPSTTVSVFNSTATTVNAFGGASVALNMGHASGATSMLGIIGLDGATPSPSAAVVVPASTTGVSSLRILPGVAPTAPVNGDAWTTSAGLFIQINGSTVGPLAAAGGSGTVSSGTVNRLSKYTGSTTVGNSLVSDDGTTLTYTGTGGISLTSSLTGIITLPGATSGNFIITAVDAMAQNVTFKLQAQTVGAAVLSIPDQLGVNRNVVSDTGAQTLTNKTTDFGSSLATDDTFTGEVISGLNNSGGVTQWDVVFLNSSSQWVKADANGSGTFPGVGVATATATTGNPTTVLIRGIFRDDGGTAWTVGSNVYLSTTAGAMTSTPPATTGDKVQVIGTALAAHTVYVHPGTDYGTAP